jgi:hypothetical protein
MQLQSGGLLRVVSPGALEKHITEQDKLKAEARDAARDASNVVAMTNLAGFIRRQFDMMRNHRNDAVAGWSERLLAAQRAFNGEYDPSKLAEIRKFGGSEVYARIVAMKCRGASSLLRDIYLAPDRAWGIDPAADPDVPPEIVDSIRQLVQAEVQGMAVAGAPVDSTMVRDRAEQLMLAARDAAKKRAARQADLTRDRIDEILEEGGYYKAIAEFLVDLPLFPFACIKGPIVRIVPSVTYQGGRAQVSQTPKMFWSRVSPFDLYWTPGVSDIEDAAIIERTRYTRADLNDLLDLPGYNHEAVRAVLMEHGAGGLADNWDSVDAERAAGENRENPVFNRSGLIACLEYHGNIQGLMLLQQGMDPKLISDPLRDYMVQAWLIGRHIIKVQMSPSPRKRHPYFITSFEKVPGTPVGHGLPDILADVAEVCNATLRTLVNNMAIASGPQVVVNNDRLAPDEDGEDMFPWKRWHVTSDPMGNNQQVPISFFMPQSNAQELLAVYQKFNEIADDLSAIPRFMAGQGASGGAGRTASGLAMLMGNASKILQTVAANIDRDVFGPSLTGLFDFLMLTDETGLLTGQESVRVMGVNVAVQRETQRARQLEFLQITANPMDAAILGPKGRAAVLREISQTIGIDKELIPDDETAMANFQADHMRQLGAEGQGGMQGGGVTGDMGPRTNITGGFG